MTSKLSQI